MRAVDLAQGKWKSVLSQLGVPLAVLDGKHHKCPANGLGEDRFRFADRNGSGSYFCACSEGDKGGMALLMCCSGMSYADTAKQVEGVVGSAVTTPEPEKRDPRIALNRVRALLKPAGFGVQRYLKERGLTTPPGIKEANLTYWDGATKLGTFTAMVGLITGKDDTPQSFHITYLDGAKKADVPSPRKVMTPVETITGGAIRLYPAAAKMGIAEGIETAIAAHMLTGLPVWAAANAGGIESFVPPPECGHLTIFGDTDKSYTGQAAAYSLAKKLRRYDFSCDVRLPDVGDWNDVLLRGVA